MRLTGTLGESTSRRCHAMDSPSRSSSVASRISSASSLSFLSLRMCSFFSGSMMYRGLKSLLVSTPKRAQASFLYFRGMSAAERCKSRIWPIDDSTMYLFPRNALMVRALAGDSTMTRDLLTRLAKLFRSEQVSTLPRGGPALRREVLGLSNSCYFNVLGDFTELVREFENSSANHPSARR